MRTGVNATGAVRPEVALIHGWAIGKDVWQPLQAALSSHCRVQRIDLPGYAESPACGSDFASAAQALLDHLPERAILCGWSLGAMLALRAALLAPQRVAGLLLVAATPCFVQRDDWPAGQASALIDGFAERLTGHAAETMQRFVVLMNQGDTQARALARALRACLQRQPPVAAEVLQQGLHWLATVDLRPFAPAIRARTLLVHGENDGLTPLPAAVWLAKAIPAARLETFAGAAHAPFLADAQRFAELARDFCCHQATR